MCQNFLVGNLVKISLAFPLDFLAGKLKNTGSGGVGCLVKYAIGMPLRKSLRKIYLTLFCVANCELVNCIRKTKIDFLEFF